MPVSSVSSLTTSAPPTPPACCGAGPTSPLSAFVLASKLPPTVSGHTTVTSPPTTCRRSAAMAEVADQDHTSEAMAAARRQVAVVIVTLLCSVRLLSRLDGDGHRVGARTRREPVDELVASAEHKGDVVRDAHRRAGGETILVLARRSRRHYVVDQQRGDEPLARRDEELGEPRDVLGRRGDRHAVDARGHVVFTEDAPAAEAEPRVGADAAAVERRRLGPAGRHADDGALLPHVDAADDSAAVLPGGRIGFVEAGTEGVRRQLQVRRPEERLRLERIGGAERIVLFPPERLRVGQAEARGQRVATDLERHALLRPVLEQRLADDEIGRAGITGALLRD